MNDYCINTEDKCKCTVVNSIYFIPVTLKCELYLSVAKLVTCRLTVTSLPFLLHTSPSKFAQLCLAAKPFQLKPNLNIEQRIG